jgi:hypothetical protein
VVNAVVDDFKARYRIRAGHALGLIKNDSARAVLCIARNQPFRADVIRMIDSALVLVTGTCP